MLTVRRWALASCRRVGSPGDVLDLGDGGLDHFRRDGDRRFAQLPQRFHGNDRPHALEEALDGLADAAGLGWGQREFPQVEAPFLGEISGRLEELRGAGQAASRQIRRSANASADAFPERAESHILRIMRAW